MRHDRREVGKPRLPAEHRLRALGRGDDAGRVAGPARGEFDPEIDARGALDRLDDFEDGKTAAVAAIQRLRLSAAAQVSSASECAAARSATWR
jgi:hypothetical protein